MCQRLSACRLCACWCVRGVVCSCVRRCSVRVTAAARRRSRRAKERKRCERERTKPTEGRPRKKRARRRRTTNRRDTQPGDTWRPASARPQPRPSNSPSPSQHKRHCEHHLGCRLRLSSIPASSDGRRPTPTRTPATRAHLPGSRCPALSGGVGVGVGLASSPFSLLHVSRRRVESATTPSRTPASEAHERDQQPPT